jgi:tRNA-splicing ligase RtcB (3'-phosphate/5'-hydroxy nucleic acid ligase)
MLNLTGKYASCTVMIDAVEPAALQQIYSFLNCPAFEGAKIRIMPDVHAGAGAVIGFTATLGERIVPNVVGVDIGCGILSICLGEHEGIDFPALDAFIREEIPCGFNVHERTPKIVEHDLLWRRVEEVANRTLQDSRRVAKSLGTLGGGNHFIELGFDANTECYWLTVHTGSRNLGLRVAEHHQKIAKTLHPHGDLSWLEGGESAQYLHDMKVCQEYAAENRRRIARKIYEGFFGRLWLGPLYAVESVHNYIDFEDGIIRKGAIRAHAGQAVVIPWNMRDGLILGRGKGNENWNQSAPHGAGRVMGRGAAKRSLSVDEYQKSMSGIWSSCVGEGTIDESPMVYKPAEEILAAIGETVEVEHVIKPVYNFKAST